MKRILAPILLVVFISALGAADTESYQFIDRLLSLPGPQAPELYEDAVIFTAPSAHRRVGVAFAYEGFAKVYWFRQLIVSQDPLGAPIPKGKKVPNPYRDSGILFYVHQLPKDLQELDYRMVIDGLWTTDPNNPLAKKDSVTGIAYSVLPLKPDKTPTVLDAPAGSLHFSFKGPPGETVTVAGNFNDWDPFMYELAEYPAGIYSLTLPLPPGTYQYVFFHRGERFLDPYNFNRIWSKDGKAASEITIP
jgi:hypothetical protein